MVHIFSQSLAGEDYVSIQKSLLFAFGFDLTQCVHISILPDECLEVMESFNVALSANHIDINLDVEQITVYILEDDGKCVQYIRALTEPDKSVLEDS